MHEQDQKTEDTKLFFSKLGKCFRDVEDNKSFRITSVVKKGLEKNYSIVSMILTNTLLVRREYALSMMTLRKTNSNIPIVLRF